MKTAFETLENLPKISHGKIKIEIIFNGNTKNIPDEVLDLMFWRGENGDGHWYAKPNFGFDCCCEDRNTGRKEALKLFLAEIKNPKNVFVYKLIY